MKRILLFCFLLISISFTLILAKNHIIPQKDTSKINIITTLFPLYDFAKIIGGDKVNVSLLLPPGVEAHDFEPKPSDILKINQADVFIYTGMYMEPWVEYILNSISIDNLKIVDASAGITLLKPISIIGNGNNTFDPHIWLDFENDIKITESILKNLEEKDPKNASYYQQNYTKYLSSLIAIDNKYKKTLSNCKSNEIIFAGHYTFGYLITRYNLNYISAQGLSPDSEPTAGDLASIIQHIKSMNIKYIFYEELSTSQIANTLQEETQVKKLLLNSAHNLKKEDFDSNVSFIDIMEQNLLTLSEGLECIN